MLYLLMKKTTLVLLLLAGFSVTSAHAQSADSLDSVPAKSPIASLTAQEYFDLKNGFDMGMARVAEIHGYPSPEEVQKHAKELALTSTQKGQLQKILDAWKFKTREMGGFLIAQETKLNNLFASGKATDGAIIYYTNKIGLYQGELRNAHLQANLKTKNLLTGEQLKKYRRLRDQTK